MPFRLPLSVLLFVLLGGWVRLHVNAEEPRPFGMHERDLLTTSRVVGHPDPPPPLTVAREFPYLTIEFIIDLVPEPGSDRFLVARTMRNWSGPSQVGRILDAHDACVFDVILESPMLIYSVIFHPRYEQNGWFYVFGNDRSGGQRSAVNRILRYTMNTPLRDGCDLESEVEIISWPSGGHDGGGMAFGSDGMLYLSTGDGTGGSDTGNKGQTLDNLNAKILRIDVDHPSPGREYSIPDDNPFLETAGSRPEIWAYGLRNPWRLTYDATSDQLWAGNNGEDLWESAYLVTRGQNYGWPIFEGNHPFHSHRERGPTPIVPATVEHSHLEGRSLTGGHVYHGTQHEFLRGAYVYGDFSTGKIWAVRHDGEQIVWQDEIADTRIPISAFAIDHDGELLVLDYVDGRIYSLVPQPAQSATAAAFPLRLSESGLFESLQPYRPVAGMIPYSVNAERWADHATVVRHMGIPGDGQVRLTRRGPWEFPEQTVLMQSFFLELEASHSQQRQPIETQLLTLQEGEWVGYSYRWNERGSDADLVPASGANRTLAVMNDESESGVREQIWHYPSRAECTVCHNRAVEYVIGINTAQLNRDHDYGGVVDNQLRTLDHISLFTRPVSANLDRYPALSSPHDAAVPLDQRARSYLHANCHHCHVYSGGGNARLDLQYSPGRLTRSRSRQEPFIGRPPEHGDFGLTAAQIVAPGLPQRSVLFYRMAKLGRGRMPYSGNELIDARGLLLIRDWIAEMVPAEPFDADQTVAQLIAAGDDEAIAAAVDPALSSLETAILAMLAIEDGKLDSLRSDAVIAAARSHPNEAVRDLFERYVPASERAPRLGEAFDRRVVLDLTGDADVGRVLYENSGGMQCKSCHLLDGQGGKIGPELKGVGSRYDRVELLETIVEPSAKIDPKYVTMRVLTESGQLVSGIVVDRTAERIVLRDAEGNTTNIELAEVETMSPAATSLMPRGLLKDLTPQQAADLLEFLAQQKQGITAQGR